MLFANRTEEVSLNEAERLGRIANVDGLRAVAVLGVIWAHVWLHSGNPRFQVGSIFGIDIDLNRAFSVVGTGVDLFFVISGFCMYLMYANKQSSFTWTGYFLFLKRRWLRIAPAFYAAVAACSLVFLWINGTVPVREFLVHIAFVQTVIPGTGKLAAPFWSLATEWQFYLMLPALIVCGKRIGFWPMVICAIGGSVIIRLFVYSGSFDTQAVWNPQLPMRLVEFMWGICVARLFSAKASLPWLLQGGRGILIGATVAYAGRLLMVTEVVNWAGPIGFASKALGEPVLTLGYSIILWNAVASSSWFGNVLGHSWFQVVGRWSYSLYLWHWWPVLWITKAMSNSFGSTAIIQYLSFAISLAVLLPVSCLSYRVLESPYFQRHSRNSAGRVVEAQI